MPLLRRLLLLLRLQKLLLLELLLLLRQVLLLDCKHVQLPLPQSLLSRRCLRKSLLLLHVLLLCRRHVRCCRRRRCLAGAVGVDCRRQLNGY